jgi:O-antigen/teichoic acid export membrane protein
MTSAGQSLLRGSAWMIGARWAMRVIGLASTIVLARLLVPEDFGVVAMALIAVGLLETIAYAGVDLALMRDGADSRDHYDTAWTIQLIQGAILALLLVVLAPLAAAYFKEPRVTAIVQFCGLRALIGGFQNIGVVAFRKELDFAKEFRFSLYSKLFNFAFTVAAAWWFRNYWALVFGMLTSAAVTVLASYRMHPYRPRLSLAAVRQIWSFSQWLMISQIGSFMNQKTDAIVVGGLVGTSAMGNYHVSHEISTMPTSELVMPMRRALFPVLAKLQTQAAEFQGAVLNSFSVVATLCLAMSFGLVSVAPEAVLLILGPKWTGAIPLVQWLALYGGFSSLVLVLEVPLWVRGRTRLSALRSWTELAVLVPLVWLATRQFGIEGAAATRAGVSAVMMLLMAYLAARSGCVRASQLWKAVWRPFIASGVMAALVTGAPLPATWPLLAILFLKILAGALMFTGVLMGLWLAAGRPEGFEATALRQLRTRAGVRGSGR